MVNGSFVFGMDGDDASVFDRTVDWAVAQGIETATFHILTPYPGTALYQRMAAARRLLHSDWDRYDTRHVVYQPASMRPDELESGYWRAYERFYAWRSIWRGAATKPNLAGQLRHLAYAAGWKKFEPAWDIAIRTRRVMHLRPVLERVLAGFSSSAATSRTQPLARPAAIGCTPDPAGDDLQRGDSRRERARPLEKEPADRTEATAAIHQG